MRATGSTPTSNGRSPGRWGRRLVLAVGVSALPVLVTGAAVWISPRPELLDEHGYSTLYVDRNDRLLRMTLAPDDRYRVFVPLERIAPVMVEATLLQEDRHFFRHPGFNPWALLRGAWKSWGPGGGRSGGSTLTMQLARLRFGLRTRTAWGKVVQVARALQIERHYDKRDILEAYLNLAPYGGNIEGIEAAARILCRRPAARLTLVQALTLVQMPRRPTRGRDPEAWAAYLAAGRSDLFARWIARHPADEAARPELALPIRLHTPADLPFRAPHFVDALAGAQRTRIGPEAGSEVPTTLDLGLQTLVEQRVRAFVGRERGRGVTNAAVLVVDARSVEAVAWVGSASFFDTAIHGQVNGVDAPRSPGSALKPFVYGLAADRGMIHPRTLLDDAPAAFGDFNPENFDRTFLGPMIAQDALVHSRNLPAVSLASRMGGDALHGLLAAARVRRLESAAHHGLSLVLGGVEVTLRELVSLYAMLARGGMWMPVRTRRDAPEMPAVRLLGPEAAWMTVAMLRANPRPGRGYDEASAGREAEVAFKTGTSAGYRDAWSVGIFGPWVLGVWVGNFDGRPNRAFVGREVATPLMFDLVDALRAREPGAPEAVPVLPPSELALARVPVCPVTGRMPGPACPCAVETWFVPGRTSIEPCVLHRSVPVVSATGMRACEATTGPTREETFEFWPSDALALFARAGISRRTPPPWSPECIADSAGIAGMAPRILSPRTGSTYRLRVGMVSGNDLPLKAVVEAGVEVVHWFVDGTYLGARAPGAIVTWPLSPGRHTVRVVDDRGRSAVRSFRVAAELGG